MSRSRRPIRVLFADHHPFTRIGIRITLEKAEAIQLVGEACQRTSLKQLTAQLGPDILLFDWLLPDIQPLQFIHWVQTHYPQTKTLILTAHDRDDVLTRALQAGAAGFLNKKEPPQRLVQAIQQVAQGQQWVTRRQIVRIKRWQQITSRWERLSKREQDVLRLLAQGLNNKDIAQTLCITVRTVECHVSKILGKLNVSSRQQALVWVQEHHLLEDEKIRVFHD